MVPSVLDIAGSVRSTVEGSHTVAGSFKVKVGVVLIVTTIESLDVHITGVPAEFVAST
jgi:hypothetical protein